MAIPALQQPNIVGNFIAGREAAQQDQAQTTQNSLRSAQLTQAQGINALNQNPNSTPEQYIRAGDPQTGNALLANQQQTSQQKQEALSQISGLAQRALAITDPGQRKQFLAQAAPAYASSFSAIGADHQNGIAQLEALPDDQLEQRLRQVAQFAPPPKPMEVAAGASLVNPNNPGTPLYTAPAKPTEVAPGGSLVDPATGKPLYTAPGKIEYHDAGDKLIPVDSATGKVIPGLPPIPKTQTPTQEGKNYAPDESQLMGALAERGVTLPAGLRSQQQMKATFRGLIDRNPGKSPDDIADLVRTGQLDFNGAKKSTGQLATQAAAANVQSAKLEKDFAQLEPLVAQMPNAPGFVNQALTGLKNNLSFGGDKDSAQFVLYLREAATEYAKLSSGSTGSAAPAEGNIKEAVAIFQKAYTEGGFQGLKTAMIQSAKNKRDAVQEGLKAASARGASTGDTVPPVTTPTTAVQTATGPNGQKLFLRNGQWSPQ